MKRQESPPILITDAARSQDDQLRSRQVRYIVMMSIRAVCLIVGAVLVSARAPLLWLWLPICGVGMILIPWLAVLLANDGPPKEKHRMSRMRHHPAGPAALPAPPAGPAPNRVIDLEP
ncbi:Protein of unknown function [Micromonospora pattaloongensis]|uniref:DUF3099 domain-containing protein n=1 Tax=Micromonospora pattaloongensis TaxID=405436 RepID=A0A1H3K669_9ACTN|nr:DUF3099 domain-containing protein [Micromonospora pattaloongensis]SDY47700.1 Protein of unknown function [Micromonospora pattaloongensis]